MKKRIFTLLTSLFLLSGTIIAQTDPTPQSLPYEQDFSALVHTSTTYPDGIQGWKIGSASTATIVTTGPIADHTLTANSSASSTAGGVHNYDGKIGFLPSTSTNPGIALAINTTDAYNISVSYDIMLIRNPYNGTTNTRINEAFLQYRVGTTDPWTTIDATSYVSNTTTQTESGNTTPLHAVNYSILLPAACEDQPVVELRWMNHEVSGSGSRPSFAVDNISVVQDSDNDGFNALNDCDDNDPSVHPDASEICNYIDDNCDGNIDEVGLTAPAIEPSGVIYLCKPDAITLSVPAGYATYQWMKNGNPLAGEIGNTYTTNKPGYYQVEVTNGLCSDVSAVQAVAVTPSPYNNISAPNGTSLCTPVKLKASNQPGYSWQWYLDGGMIPGATNYLYNPTVAGSYYCTIMNAYGCTKNTAALDVTACRASEWSNAGIILYPNPGNGTFHFTADDTYSGQEASVYVSDVTGKMVYAQVLENVQAGDAITIDLPDAIPAGIYMVRIESMTHIRTGSISVQR